MFELNSLSTRQSQGWTFRVGPPGRRDGVLFDFAIASLQAAVLLTVQSCHSSSGSG